MARKKKNADLETTIVSIRMSYAAKKLLNELADDLKVLNQKDPDKGLPKADMTTIIKVAIQHTWGIDCDE
jgi:hypothetical protein